MSGPSGYGRRSIRKKRKTNNIREVLILICPPAPDNVNNSNLEDEGLVDAPDEMKDHDDSDKMHLL